MNKISDNTINNFLKQQYDSYCSEYGENQILGTFVVGLANYGFARDEKDLYYFTVYLPKFCELCTGDHKSENYAADDVMLDMRTMYQATKDHAANLLELLFCNYKIINPKYENLYMEYFENKREEIAHASEKSRFARSFAGIQDSFKRNDSFTAMRLYISSKLYADGYTCEECFHIDNAVYESVLTELLEGKNCTEEDIQSMLNDVNDFYNAASDDNIDIIKDYKKGIIKIIEKSLETNISLDAFEDGLTTTEKKGWEVLKTKFVDGTTSISISKIIEETGISRPVWKNLLLKLEQNNVATIVNKGAKGTMITLK